MISDTVKRQLAAAMIIVLTAVAAAAQEPASVTVPTLQSSNPFAGSVPRGSASPQPIALSIADAIHRALEYNLGVLQAAESIDRANGARWLALSDLLPHVDAGITESRRTVNLEAFGFPLNRIPLPDNASFPTVVGPFNVFDARVTLSQRVFDLDAINEHRARVHDMEAARHDSRSARDFVVLVSANAYLQVLAAAARAETARAQLQTSQALYQQAQDLRQSGIVAGLDVTRAEVRMSADRQRATAAENEFQKSKLRLARVIGLPVGQEFTLSSQLPEVPVPDITFEEALDRAYRERPDYLAAQERVRAAESTLAAAKGEALPSVRVDADFGAIGLTPDTARSTFNVTGGVSVPIFNGGHLQGRVAQAEVDLRARRNDVENMKSEIAFDVRSAFLDLKATEEELQTSTRARELANQALEQSRDRFAAGVATNIEVIQAQEAVTLANEQYIAALYGYNVSKALLARSLGTAESAVERYLGGANK